MTKEELTQLAEAAKTDCGSALQLAIELNLMIDITDDRVSVKGMAPGMLHDTKLSFKAHEKQRVVMLAISRAAQKELEHV